MEMLGESVTVQKLFASWTVESRQKALGLDAKLEQVDLKLVMFQVADQIANFHISHWMDKDLLEKGKSIMFGSSYYLGEDKPVFDKNLKDFSAMCWIAKNIATKYIKKFPLAAKAAENALKQTTWQNA